MYSPNLTSELRSPSEGPLQNPAEKKSGVVNTRPTYGFRFIEDFDPQRYGELKDEFEFADFNKNGTLSRQELENYLENKMKNILKDEYRPRFIDEIFGKMDENYDGIVTLEEFSHFYYRTEDDFNLRIKHLKEENQELLSKRIKLEDEMRTTSDARPASFLHLNIIQGNFSDSDVKWTSNDIRHMKLRVSVQYHQGKERFSEQSSRTIFSTLNPIWNDLLVFELDSHNQNQNTNFTLKVEQMEKQNRKLEVKKELGRFNMGFENFESIPTEEQAVYIVDPYKKTSNNNVGILEVQFEFIISESSNKEKMIRNIKEQMENNSQVILDVEKDLKYLLRLFGTKPNVPKPPPAIYTYNYGFFDNFSLFHQPIDKFTPKLGFDLEKKMDYLKYWEIVLYQYFPFVIFMFSLLICCSRADFLTLIFVLKIMPYCKYEWLKFQFLYAKLILLLVITTDFFWLVFTFNEWNFYYLGLAQSGHAMNCIVWVLSLINFFFKIFYEIFLIYIFHKVRHGYGYGDKLAEVRERAFRNREDLSKTTNG